MLLHKKCGNPIDTGDSRDEYIQEGGLAGYFCSVCKDDTNLALEVDPDTDTISVDMETLV